MYACLYEHPEICMPRKEINFFSRERNWTRGFGWYERIFAECPPMTITGEFSTSYLSDRATPARIRERYPAVRLIVSLRQPVDRAYSSYLNDIAAGVVATSTGFGEALRSHPEYVDGGRYARHLRAYLELFPRDQLLVSIFDDARRDPLAAIQEIYRFLGVDPTFRPSLLDRPVGVGRVPRAQWFERTLIDAAAAFRTRRILRPIWWTAKRLGVGDRARALNTRHAAGSPTGVEVDERVALMRELEPDIRALEQLLQRELSGWLLTAPEVRRRLSVVFISQAVDGDDPVLPHTLRWIEALARKPSVDHTAVLALRTGRYDFPSNVDVYRFGRSNRLLTLFAFYRGVLRFLRPRPDFFFVHQGGPYPLLLVPFRTLSRIPIVQWKAHSVITRTMAFYARRCDDLIFTATPASFPMSIPKLRVVGHGIDTQAFRNAPRARVGDLVAVGRIAPTKRIEQMVHAVAYANRTYGRGYQLDIYGPTLPGDERYAGGIEALIDRLAARAWVTLHGPVLHERLPDLLNGHRACLNFTRGAIDKSALEAMACGLPVISINDAVAETMPPDLRPLLVTDKQRPEVQARTIHELLARPDSELETVGDRLRATVIADHSVDRLFDRILEDVRTLV